MPLLYSLRLQTSLSNTMLLLADKNTVHVTSKWGLESENKQFVNIVGEHCMCCKLEAPSPI